MNPRRPIASLRSALREPSWRYALAWGLASLPFTAALSWGSATDVELAPVVIAGLLAGYVHGGRGTPAQRIGFRTGLIGGLPTAWLWADLLVHASTLPSPTWFLAVGTVFVTVAFAVFTVLLAVTTALAAMLGSWLAEKTGRTGPTATTDG